MKRSASTELDRDTVSTKRPRLDGQNEEKCLDVQMDVANVADIPSAPASFADALNESTTTTIHDLPLEILGNHVFKFFDFAYWLKSLVHVCKFWQSAAVQSTVDKQLRVNYSAIALIKKYKVSTLIVNFEIHLHDLVLLVNASPRITSLQINQIKDFNWALTPAAISKFSLNNITTLSIASSDLKLLRFFPKASRVSLSGYKIRNFTSTSVQEVALQQGSLKDIQVALIDTRTVFPAVHTIYFVVDGRFAASAKSEPEVTAAIEAFAAKLPGVSLVYTYRDKSSMFSKTSYQDFFNTFGHTPLCHAYADSSSSMLEQVFEQYPTLTWEYEQDFISRMMLFSFPHIKVGQRIFKINEIQWRNISEQSLKLCYEKKMLPQKGEIHYHIKQSDYKAIIDMIKLNQIDEEWPIEEIPSLVKMYDQLGPETFKATVTPRLFFEWIAHQRVNWEDLSPLKDVLSFNVLKYAYSRQLQRLVRQADFTNAEFEYLVQIDSLLHPDSSRRVSNQPNTGIQFLSDEAQAKYFVVLLKKYEHERIINDSQKASKPLNQMIHKGKSLQGYFNVGTKITEMITKFNFDVNQIDSHGKTPLIYAIERGNVTNVLELLQLGADPNLAGSTLLPLNHCLLQSNFSFPILNALLMYGADINRRDYDKKGRTSWPITIALSHSPQKAKYLLDCGADPTVIDEAGNTLLHLLFRKDFSPHLHDTIYLLRLLAPQIDINKKNNLGNAVLHYVASNGWHVQLVKALISIGADVNLTDAFGHTPIFIATTYSKLDTIKALLATNAVDIKARTKEGLSLAIFVFWKMQGSCVSLLNDKEFMTICQPYLTEENMQFIKDECQDKISILALHELVTSHITIAKFFVELGYNVQKHSHSLLSRLNPQNCSEVFDYLLANGLDINAKNGTEDTRLFAVLEDLPMTKEKANKIQFLLKHGASVTEKNKCKIAAIDIDPLIETRYANGLHIDYIVANYDKDLPDANLMELRQKKA